MSKANKKRDVVAELRKMVLDGWQPTYKEIRDGFFPKKEVSNSYRREQLARALIAKLRYQLKRENLYFYCVNGHFKLLESVEDRHDITKKLLGYTQGFAKSTSSLVDDTAEKFPMLGEAHLNELRGAFKVLVQLTDNMSGSLIKLIEGEVKESESENKKLKTR